MSESIPAALFWHFLLLCAIAVGGTSTVMPDMYRFVVDEHAWLTAGEFAELYTLAQVSPGPNALWVTLIGLQVAGWQGAAATTLALLIPSVAFSLGAVALHARNPESRLALAVRSGLAPVALGFMFAGAWLLLRSVGQEWQGYALSAATVAIVLRTRLNPLWLIGLGALAGVFGWV